MSALPLLLRGLAPLCLTLAWAACAATSVAADEPAPKKTEPVEKPEVVSITTSPAMSPLPALKHRLIFERLELRRGNAALMYLKGMLLAQSVHKVDPKIDEKISQWLDLPPGELPREEVKQTLARYRTVCDQLDLAVRRDHCDWEVPLHEAEDPFGILLPDQQEMRNLARMMKLKARLEMAEGKWDEALLSIKTGLTMGRHCAAGPTLINGLVGIAISNMMLQELKTWLDRPNAPSLYWALTTVPHPWIDLNPSLELDVNSMYLLFPNLYAARNNKRLSDEEWKGLQASIVTKTAKLAKQYGDLFGDGQGGSPFDVAGRVAKSLAAMAAAKKTLARYGIGEAESTAMSVEKLSLTHDILVYEEARDGILWAFSVPYHKMPKTGEQGKGWESLPSTIVLPDPKQILPAAQQARRAEARLERHFAALRLIEALRLHAGTNDGKLPAKLADVTIVPISDNPFTGEPFGYRLDGDTAVIEAAGQAPQEYRVKLRAVK